MVGGTLQGAGSDEHLIELLDSHRSLLGWVDTKSSLSHGIENEDTLYWHSGIFDSLSCFGRLHSSKEVYYYCGARSEYQHYPRVDR